MGHNVKSPFYNCFSTLIFPSKEYYVFTFLTLLTSCGGAMGLFVGWSLFELRLPVEAAVDIVARRSRVKGAIAAKFDLRRKLQSAGKARV